MGLLRNGRDESLFKPKDNRLTRDGVISCGVSVEEYSFLPPLGWIVVSGSADTSVGGVGPLVGDSTIVSASSKLEDTADVATAPAAAASFASPTPALYRVSEPSSLTAMEGPARGDDRTGRPSR